MSDTQEIQRILILNLVSDNPVTERSIVQFLPPSSARRVYRITDYGASATPQGGADDQRAWHAWTNAVDRLLAQVRQDLGDDGEFVHYYVAGRAGPPIFVYLGVRLGKQARVTMINQRPQKGPWDVVAFQEPTPGAETAPTGATPDKVSSGPAAGIFFEHIKGLAPGFECQGTGKVAVFVSTQLDTDTDNLRSFARSLDVPLAGIITIRALPEDPATGARRWLGSNDGPRAAAELEERFTQIKHCYPCHEGLIVFVVGPSSLALMVGWAINPRIYPPIWVPYFRGGAYEPAVEIPWPLVSGGKPTILIATANPPDDESTLLDIERELHHMLKILEHEVGKDRCAYHLCLAVNRDDLMDAIRKHQPHILHFSGHGDHAGTWFRSPDGKEQFVTAAELEQMLRETAKNLRLLVLCSCRSAQQASALRKIADCTVGTTADVLDESAIAFSRQFYAALTHGSSVQSAFNQGKARAEGRAYAGGCQFELFRRDGVEPDQVVLFSPADRTS